MSSRSGWAFNFVKALIERRGWIIQYSVSLWQSSSWDILPSHLDSDWKEIISSSWSPDCWLQILALICFHNHVSHFLLALFLWRTLTRFWYQEWFYLGCLSFCNPVSQFLIINLFIYIPYWFCIYGEPWWRQVAYLNISIKFY